MAWKGALSTPPSLFVADGGGPRLSSYGDFNPFDDYFVVDSAGNPSARPGLDGVRTPAAVGRGAHAAAVAAAAAAEAPAPLETVLMSGTAPGVPGGKVTEAAVEATNGDSLGDAVSLAATTLTSPPLFSPSIVRAAAAAAAATAAAAAAAATSASGTGAESTAPASDALLFGDGAAALVDPNAALYAGVMKADPTIGHAGPHSVSALAATDALAAADTLATARFRPGEGPLPSPASAAAYGLLPAPTAADPHLGLRLLAEAYQPEFVNRAASMRLADAPAGRRPSHAGASPWSTTPAPPPSDAAPFKQRRPPPLAVPMSRTCAQKRRALHVGGRATLTHF